MTKRNYLLFLILFWNSLSLPPPSPEVTYLIVGLIFSKQQVGQMVILVDINGKRISPKSVMLTLNNARGSLR